MTLLLDGKYLRIGDDMKEENFASLEELYQKLLPALRTKKNEMIREK